MKKLFSFKELGALKVKSDSNNPADVDVISQELDQVRHK